MKRPSRLTLGAVKQKGVRIYPNLASQQVLVFAQRKQLQHVAWFATRIFFTDETDVIVGRRNLGPPPAQRGVARGPSTSSHPQSFTTPRERAKPLAQSQQLFQPIHNRAFYFSFDADIHQSPSKARGGPNVSGR